MYIVSRHYTYIIIYTYVYEYIYDILMGWGKIPTDLRPILKSVMI